MRPFPTGRWARGSGTGRSAPDAAPRPASVKRVRDKYEAELVELEQSERKLQERCSELKGRLAEAEGECVRLRGVLRQKDQELADLRAVSRAGSGAGAGGRPGALPAATSHRPCGPR